MMTSCAFKKLFLVGLLCALPACHGDANSAVALPPCFEELSDISQLPGGPLYNISQRVNNPQWNRVPAPFVVLPTSAADVQRALQCASDNGLQIAVKAGGHGFGGYSAVGGKGSFVIAFTNMTGVAIGSSSTTNGTVVPSVTVQSGGRWGDVYSALNGTEHVVVGGLCPTVGVVGYVQGGGVGPLSRSLGLAADSVLSFTVVTANGSDVVHANASHNADLYWALRGSGGGNYGVVVDVTLQLHPAPPVFTWSLLCYACNQSAQVFSTVAAMVGSGSMTNAVNIDLVASPSTNSTSNDCNVCAWAIVQGDQAASNASLAPLLPPAMSPDPSASSVATYSRFYDMIVDYAVAHGYGEFSNEAYSSKNCLVPTASVVANGTGFAGASTQLLLTSPDACSIHWIQFGGAVANNGVNATAFPWRDAAYMTYAVCGFQDAAGYTQADAYLHGFASSMAPYCSGSYVNFIDPSQVQQGWGGQYYGANLPALVDIKQRWAPPGLTPLRFAQEIGPGAQ